MTKRKRKSDAEVLADTLAKAERLKRRIAAKEAGLPVTAVASEVSRLKRAKRRRETALHRAQVALNGKPGTEKSPALPGIEQKIENAQRRLNDLMETRNRALEQIAQLPDDIQRLGILIEAENRGEEVDFPTDLYRLPGDQTDAEAETVASIDMEEGE